MKKAQILSAIALAFALGVVAPVASTTLTASAVEVTTPATKVSTADLKAAIAKAESNATYKAYTVLSDTSSYTDINETTLLTALNGKIEALNAAYTGDEQAETLADALKVAIETETAAKYTAFANLYNAINDKASLNFDNIADLAKKAGFTVTLAEDEAKDVNALVTKITADTGYTSYSNLIKAVKDANDAIKAQGENVTTLKNALNTWGYQTADVINTAAATKLEADGSNGPVKALVALATPALNGKVEQKANYADLATKIGNAKTAAEAGDEEDNATALKAMETAFYKATGIVLSTVPTPADGTGDGTNKPDDEKDPSAPDTGILSNTEASASTTLAMVAGIATALTAAGAGVVAYRNARRANK